MRRAPASLAAVAASAVAAGVLAGCTAEPTAPAAQPVGSASAVEPTPPSPTPTSPPPPSSTPTPTRTTPPPRKEAPPPPPEDAPAPAPRAAAMQATVTRLAGGIGPREATSRAFREGAELVEAELRGLGYAVERQPFRVPAGVSWGVQVPAGPAFNVVATPPSYVASRPHLLVGAHLDTVPQAPGAEDNASGVAVVLELARLAADGDPGLPVVFVAFGAEEPRGPGDALHHFGSQHYVRGMTTSERRALAGMVSLDRVGVGARVPVCFGGLGDGAYAREVREAARRARVPASFCSDNTTSDHWSFEKAGLPAARLGSTPYAEYHSAADRPGVTSPWQLQRTARVAWQAIRDAAAR